ncbi:hypothetical protein H4R19_001847, partial [Coemansia spiralis]
MSVYPAKQHLANVATRLGASAGVIFVRGGETIVHPDSDTEYDFHQDSNFYYVSGVAEPGFAAAYDIATGTAILFVRHVSADEAVWIGVPPSLEDYRTAHGFDEAHYVHDIGTVLDALKPSAVYMLPHHAADQLGMALELAVDREQLLPAVHEARVFKDDAEIEVMRAANRISSDAHIALMMQVRSGMNEAEVRGRFVGMVLARGCSYEAYGSIAARGRNAATLHYTANNQPLADDAEMILVD